MEDQWYSVSVEAVTPPLDEEQLDAFVTALGDSTVMGSAGGEHPSLGATFGVDAPAPLLAGSRALKAFTRAAAAAGIQLKAIEEVRVQTESALDRELAQAPESYVGVTEIARILGVSKQRVSELREKPEFPKPIAQLASGPVWARSMLNRFIAEWPRRRTGRPPKTRVEEFTETLAKSVKAAQKEQFDRGIVVRKKIKAAAKKGSRKRVAS